MSRLASTLLIGSLALIGCGEAPTPEWVEEGDHRWRELRVDSRGGPGFERVSARRTGIDVSSDLSREEAARDRHLTQGSGVALGDMDGDGRLDVFIARIDGSNALYRNLGGWRFEEVAEIAGVAAPDRRSTGAVFADIDGDGDLDLVVAALGGPNAVFVNDGAGRFTERVLGTGRGSTTLALADIEGDGDLDLYVTNYKVRSAMDRYSPAERAFDNVVEQTDEGYHVRDPFAADFRVYERPDLGTVVFVQRAEADVLYLNDGAGGFTAEPFTSGRFLDEDGTPLASEPDLFGLSARFYDVTGDGAPELFVANDFEDPDHFWINDGQGGFRAASPWAIRQTSNAAMAVDFADVDRDGDVDFFEVDMLARDRGLRMTQNPTHTLLPKQVGVLTDRPQTMRNSLFLSRGDGTFAQVADWAGVAASDWSWGTHFLDVDLDGFEDILVTTGHAWDIMDSDTQRRLGGLGQDWREEFLLFPTLSTPNVAFRNLGDGRFEAVDGGWGFAGDPDVSHGIASGDLDGDGDLDVVVTRLDQEPLVLENTATAPRVAVRLSGRPPNTGGVGASVALEGGAVDRQQKEVTAGGLYLSGAEGLLTFAASGGPMALEVRWRDGTSTRVEGVQEDRLYDIRQPSESDGSSTEAAAPEPTSAPPHFEDVSDQLGHAHHESDFDDESRQPLLPNALSRFGPGVAWHDSDDDGDPDLWIPAGRGGRLSLFRNRGGAFDRVESDEESPLDQTMVLPLTMEEGPTILVARSSYEAATPQEAFAAPSVVEWSPDGSAALDGVVPGDTTSVGVLASADVDGDGDLDLFVGGRVVPALYPLSTGSRLFLRESGAWVRDPAADGVLRGVGMISSATFTDIDADGDPDLLLAPEWGRLILLLNRGGRFERAEEGRGLGPASRWLSVATGDFDADGRPDVLATSWGENVPHRPEADRPLRLYAGDLDRSGSVDLVQAQADVSSGRIFPLDRLERLTRAIPGLARRVDSHGAYADASVSDLFGDALGASVVLEAEDYRHVLFLNRGDRFDARPLPPMAQFAPATHVGVADLDGDGHEDAFLSQNFYPTGPEHPRLDAGRGLWLRGDGTGGLTPVQASTSGLRIYGDGRGGAFGDFDADGRVDLVVTQNGAATRLYRNVGAAPGLRVVLRGPMANPNGIGAVLRLIGPGGVGPAREVKAGSGRGAVDSAVHVLGGLDGATGLRVRWPGGEVQEVALEEGAREVVVSYGGAPGRP